MNSLNYGRYEDYQRAGGSFSSNLKNNNVYDMPNFQQFCAIRDFLHVKNCDKRCPINYTQNEDSRMSYFWSMEHQWQFFKRSEGMNSMNSYSNIYNPWANTTMQINNQHLAGISGSVKQENGMSKFQQDGASKKKMKRTKKWNNLGKPKRPLTSFMLFLKDSRSRIVNSLPKGSSSQDINREVGRSWHALTEEEKQMYKKKAAEALRQWKIENGELKEQKLPTTVPVEKIAQNYTEKKAQDELQKSTSESSGSSSSESCSSDEE
ncbi:UNVERIFIED_CONTAM: hypothetical protein RMT77_007224 [Armadillidium vulgare]